MSKILHYFESPEAHTVVALPFSLPDFIQGWTDLRKVMVRTRPEEFTREEWSYLIGFLREENLYAPFVEAFGRRSKTAKRAPTRLIRPRGPIALWLPNNVSLLGPLSVILLSLTGNRLRIKTGSRGQDVTTPFLEFCRSHARASGPLGRYLRQVITAEHFDREDPRNTLMSQDAQVRIVFGSDQAVAALEALPHPLHSAGFAFSDRQSQAWIEPRAMTDKVLVDLIKVLAVYGQAGCTSPQKVIVIGGNRQIALTLRDSLVRLWPKVIPRDPPMDAASENLMVFQWATLLGWEPALAPRQGAVFAVGTLQSPPFQGRLALPIIPATLEQARAQLPVNIQTLGYALSKPALSKWIALLGDTAIKRFVPVAEMHHFGAVWDGLSYWRQGFEEVSMHFPSKS